MTPFVDIVLLNYNGWRHTLECLESVMRLDYPAFRVIVCDNRSTDDSLERIQGWLRGEESAPISADMPASLRAFVTPPVSKPIDFEVVGASGHPVTDARVVLVPLDTNAGFAAGNNAGMEISLRSARADFVWLLNNDTVVAPDALSALVRAASADPRCGATGGTLFEYATPDIVQMASGAVVFLSTGAMTRMNQGGVRRSALDVSARDFNFIIGGCLFLRADAIREVGVLDERFFLFGEDADYSLRIAAKGWHIGYAADAHVWHKGGGTTQRGTALTDYHNVRSSLLLVHKWRPGSLPVALGYWAYRGVAPKIWRRQWDRLSAVCRAYRDALKQVRSA